MKNLAGFTLVELVMAVVILGILSAVAIPRFFDTGMFQSRGFADQVQASLRYAQKIAIAQRRFVCAAFTSNSVTLTINAAPACPGGDLASPAGGAAYRITAPAGVVFSAAPAGFYFDALGKPSFAANQTITVNNAPNSIVVEAETGYVHSP